MLDDNNGIRQDNSKHLRFSHDIDKPETETPQPDTQAPYIAGEDEHAGEVKAKKAKKSNQTEA